jgi:hypothetical protein
MALTGKYEVGHEISEIDFLSGGKKVLGDVYKQGVPVDTNPLSVGYVGGSRLLIDTSQPTLIRYENIPCGLEGKLNTYLRDLKEKVTV